MGGERSSSMTIKYLDSKRIRGVASEKAALTPATDSLGTSANGTNAGAALVTTDEKLGTGCLDFDGSNDYISSSGRPDFQVGDSFSISLWFKTTSTSFGSIINQWGTQNGGSNNGWSLLDSGTAASFRFSSSWSSNAIRVNTSTDGAFSDGNWHHLAMTYNGSGSGGVIFYLDGAVKSSSADLAGTVGSITYGLGLAVGAYSGGYSDKYTGKLDDIAIWDTVLTSTEVGNLWASGTGALANTIPAGQLVYYNCDSATVNNNAPTTSSNLPENTIFEETDTQSTWWLQDGKWKGANHPLQVSSLWAWYKAESKYMTFGTGGAASKALTWNPQTNLTGKKLIPDSSDLAPFFEANSRNGRGIIKFKGVQAIHTYDDSYRLTQPMTFVIVMKFPTALDDKTIFDADNTGNRLLHRNTGTAGTQLEMNNGAVFTSTATTAFAGNWGYEILVFDGSSSKWRINGVDVAPSTFNPSSDFNPLTIGSDYRAGTGHNNIVGDFMHFIIYDKALSDAEITDMEEWCASEVGT